MVEMKIEAQTNLLVMVDNIPMDLLVEVLVPMTSQMVMIVVPQMILMEMAQIVPLLLSLEDDTIRIDVINNMSNFIRV